MDRITLEDVSSAILNKALKLGELLHINKYTKGDDTDIKYRQNIYNLIDPTAAYPSDNGEALGMLMLASKAKSDSIQPVYRDKDILPTAEAAWAKRLGLNYDTSVLQDNGDGTVRLNRKYENEIPVDTNFIKQRIADNTKLKNYYKRLDGLSTNRAKIINDGIEIDKKTLTALRKTYSTGKPVVINEHAHNSRSWVNNGKAKYTKSPLSPLQNFTIQYDKKNNKMNYFDVYDFNKFENYVPGKPFTIKGSVPLKRKTLTKQ